MNELQHMFRYENCQIRTVIRDGEPWFVAKDVCAVLEHTNHKIAISRLDEDEVTKVYLTDSLGRMQETVCVNEPGLYSLVLRSNKPEAKAFKRWIIHEVIPTIRKKGHFTAYPKTQAELALMIAQNLVEQEKQIQLLSQKVTTVEHRMDNLDRLDLIGDLQQRLCAMIRKYALIKGVGFQRAWRDFRQAFNLAYHTNLTLLIENYKAKHGISNLTMPAYLSKVERLEDAIRVADKMLNQAS